MEVRNKIFLFRLRLGLLIVPLVFFGAGSGAFSQGGGSRAVWLATESESPVKVYAFSGSDLSCRWLIRGTKGGELEKVTLDIFQILSATVAPLEKGLVMGEHLSPEEGRPVEIDYKFEVPGSDRQVRYFLKLWKEQGDKRMLVGATLVTAVPATILEEFSGIEIAAVGFDNDDSGEWAEVLKEAGIKLKWLKRIPDDKKGGDITFVKSGKKGNEHSLRDLNSANLRPDQMLVHFETGHGADSIDRIFSSENKGMIMWTELAILNRLKESAGARVRLAAILTEGQKLKMK